MNALLSGNTLNLVLTTENDRIGEILEGSPLPGCQHCPVLFSVIFQYYLESGNLVSQEKFHWRRGNYAKISDGIFGWDWEVIFGR